jgi:hypothetical protein
LVFGSRENFTKPISFRRESLDNAESRFLMPRMLFSPTIPPDHMPGVTGFL